MNGNFICKQQPCVHQSCPYPCNRNSCNTSRCCNNNNYCCNSPCSPSSQDSCNNCCEIPCSPPRYGPSGHPGIPSSPQKKPPCKRTHTPPRRRDQCSNPPTTCCTPEAPINPCEQLLQPCSSSHGLRDPCRCKNLQSNGDRFDQPSLQKCCPSPAPSDNDEQCPCPSTEALRNFNKCTAPPPLPPKPNFSPPPPPIPERTRKLEVSVQTRKRKLKKMMKQTPMMPGGGASCWPPPPCCCPMMYIQQCPFPQFPQQQQPQAPWSGYGMSPAYGNRPPPPPPPPARSWRGPSPVECQRPTTQNPPSSPSRQLFKNQSPYSGCSIQLSASNHSLQCTPRQQTPVISPKSSSQRFLDSKSATRISSPTSSRYCPPCSARSPGNTPLYDKPPSNFYPRNHNQSRRKGLFPGECCRQCGIPGTKFAAHPYYGPVKKKALSPHKSRSALRFQRSRSRVKSSIRKTASSIIMTPSRSRARCSTASRSRSQLSKCSGSTCGITPQRSASTSQVSGRCNSQHFTSTFPPKNRTPDRSLHKHISLSNLPRLHGLAGTSNTSRKMSKSPPGLLSRSASTPRVSFLSQQGCCGTGQSRNPSPRYGSPSARTISLRPSRSMSRLTFHDQRSRSSSRLRSRPSSRFMSRQSSRSRRLKSRPSSVSRLRSRPSSRSMSRLRSRQSSRSKSSSRLRSRSRSRSMSRFGSRSRSKSSSRSKSTSRLRSRSRSTPRSRSRSANYRNKYSRSRSPTPTHSRRCRSATRGRTRASSSSPSSPSPPRFSPYRYKGPETRTSSSTRFSPFKYSNTQRSRSRRFGSPQPRAGRSRSRSRSRRPGSGRRSLSPRRNYSQVSYNKCTSGMGVTNSRGFSPSRCPGGSNSFGNPEMYQSQISSNNPAHDPAHTSGMMYPGSNPTGSFPPGCCCQSPGGAPSGYGNNNYSSRNNFPKSHAFSNPYTHQVASQPYGNGFSGNNSNRNFDTAHGGYPTTPGYGYGYPSGTDGRCGSCPVYFYWACPPEAAQPQCYPNNQNSQQNTNKSRMSKRRWRRREQQQRSPSPGRKANVTNPPSRRCEDCCDNNNNCCSSPQACCGMDCSFCNDYSLTC